MFNHAFGKNIEMKNAEKKCVIKNCVVKKCKGSVNCQVIRLQLYQVVLQNWEWICQMGIFLD